MKPLDQQPLPDDEEPVSPRRAAERLHNAMAVAYHDQSRDDLELVQEDWKVSVETWPEYEDA